MLNKQCWAMLMLNTANADKIQCQYKPFWSKRQETLGAGEAAETKKMRLPVSRAAAAYGRQLKMTLKMLPAS